MLSERYEECARSLGGYSDALELVMRGSVWKTMRRTMMATATAGMELQEAFFELCSWWVDRGRVLRTRFHCWKSHMKVELE